MPYYYKCKHCLFVLLGKGNSIIIKVSVGLSLSLLMFFFFFSVSVSFHVVAILMKNEKKIMIIIIIIVIIIIITIIITIIIIKNFINFFFCYYGAVFIYSALIYSQLHQVRHQRQVSHFDHLFPSKQENTKRHTIIDARWQAGPFCFVDIFTQLGYRDYFTENASV